MVELSADLFRNVIGQLDFKFDQRRGEKRSMPRVHIGRRVPYVRHAASPARAGKPRDPTALVREISVRGAGLLLPHAVTVGEDLILMLPCTVGQSVPVECRVVRCQRCGKDGAAHTVGVEFIAILDPSDVTPQALEMRRIRQAILAN